MDTENYSVITNEVIEDLLKNILKTIQSARSRHMEIGENDDEVVIYLPEKYRGKNIVIIYNKRRDK